MISDESIEETRWVDERDYQQYRREKAAKKVSRFYVTQNTVYIDLWNGQPIPVNDDCEIFDRLIDKYLDVIIREGNDSRNI